MRRRPTHRRHTRQRLWSRPDGRLPHRHGPFPRRPALPRRAQVRFSPARERPCHPRSPHVPALREFRCRRLRGIQSVIRPPVLRGLWRGSLPPVRWFRRVPIWPPSWARHVLPCRRRRSPRAPEFPERKAVRRYPANRFIVVPSVPASRRRAPVPVVPPAPEAPVRLVPVSVQAVRVPSTPPRVVAWSPDWRRRRSNRHVDVQAISARSVSSVNGLRKREPYGRNGVTWRPVLRPSAAKSRFPRVLRLRSYRKSSM